jgi:hypothetical protein
MFPKRSGIALLLLLVGCGGGSDDGGDSPDEKPRPQAKVNHEPRVEGEWRVVYTPVGFGEGQELRATWTVTPSCKAGSCDFKIESDQGARHHFEYDPAIKDWTGSDRQRDDCTAENGDVIMKGAYRIRSQITLTPIRAVRNANGTFVTEMFGDRRDRITMAPGAEDAGCEFSSGQQESVRAVRADPPVGKAETVGPKVEEGIE